MGSRPFLMWSLQMQVFKTLHAPQQRPHRAATQETTPQDTVAQANINRSGMRPEHADATPGVLWLLTCGWLGPVANCVECCTVSRLYSAVLVQIYNASVSQSNEYHNRCSCSGYLFCLRKEVPVTSGLSVFQGSILCGYILYSEVFQGSVL